MYSYGGEWRRYPNLSVRNVVVLNHDDSNVTMLKTYRFKSLALLLPNIFLLLCSVLVYM
jgi:hypothetical protein